MRKFVGYILILLGITFFLMIVFDLVYTYVYNNGAHRNKVMWVRSMNNEPPLDYAIIGSSRAVYHVDPLQIDAETGLNGLNLGVEAFTPFEMSLFVKEFLKRKKVERLFVQLDSQYLYELPDNIGEKNWFPYFWEDGIYEHFEGFGSRYKAYRYIPFYRYSKYESRIGFRNIVSSALGKGLDYNSSKGFVSRDGIIQEEKPYIPDREITKPNKYIEEIVALCKAEQIEISFFTAPIYKFRGSLAFLSNYYPNYTDFKDSITDRQYFLDQTHLNTEGAKVFTEMFINTYFKE